MNMVYNAGYRVFALDEKGKIEEAGEQTEYLYPRSSRSKPPAAHQMLPQAASPLSTSWTHPQLHNRRNGASRTFQDDAGSSQKNILNKQPLEPTEKKGAQAGKVCIAGL